MKKLTKQEKIKKLCQEKTLNHHFSDYNTDLEYDDIIENLEKYIDSGNILIWDEYENAAPEHIVDLMKNYCDSQINFANQILKIKNYYN